MKQKKTLISIALYLIWLIIFIVKIASGSFDRIGIYLILILLVLLIKDILLYMVTLKPTETIVYNTKKAKEELKIGEQELGIGKRELGIGKRKVSKKFYYYLLINRVYIFPAVLVIYLVYLLIGQTHIWNLQNNMFYIIINGTVLLAIVIVSGLLTIWKEGKDTAYQATKSSMNSTYMSIGLSIILSLVGTYIIYGQTTELGRLRYIISGIAGLLIFLIGVMIVEEEPGNEEVGIRK